MHRYRQESTGLRNRSEGRLVAVLRLGALPLRTRAGIFAAYYGLCHRSVPPGLLKRALDGQTQQAWMAVTTDPPVWVAAATAQEAGGAAFLLRPPLVPDTARPSFRGAAVMSAQGPRTPFPVTPRAMGGSHSLTPAARSAARMIRAIPGTPTRCSTGIPPMTIAACCSASTICGAAATRRALASASKSVGVS